MTRAVTAISRTMWERLLQRWCGMERTGEVRLVCAVLADEIVDPRRDYFVNGGGFAAYCRAIGLDPAFVNEQVVRAGRYIAAMMLDSDSQGA